MLWTIYIFWYAIVLHLVWGVLLLTSPVPLRTTTLALFDTAVHPHWVAGLIFIAVGVAAMIGIFVVRERPGRIPQTRIAALLLMPQQCMLLISALSAIEAMLVGQFGDGVQRPHAFIIADQCPAVLAAMLHTIAIITYVRAARIEM